MENINAGPACAEAMLQKVTAALLQVEQFHNSLRRVMSVFQVSLCDFSRTQLESLVNKLKAAFTGELLCPCCILTVLRYQLTGCVRSAVWCGGQSSVSPRPLPRTQQPKKWKLSLQTPETTGKPLGPGQ